MLPAGHRISFARLLSNRHTRAIVARMTWALCGVGSRRHVRSDAVYKRHTSIMTEATRLDLHLADPGASRRNVSGEICRAFASQSNERAAASIELILRYNLGGEPILKLRTASPAQKENSVTEEGRRRMASPRGRLARLMERPLGAGAYTA